MIYEFIACELCSENCRYGALHHFVEYGHVPVVGGEPIFVGIRRRAVWRYRP